MVTRGDTYGVALLHQHTESIPGTVYTIPAASTFDVPELNTFKPGYFAAIDVVFPSNATVPFVRFRLSWRDMLNNVIMVDHWTVAGGTTSASTVYQCKGPVKGPKLVILIDNYDPAQNATVTIWWTETTHHINRDDWRSQDFFQNVPANSYAEQVATCDPPANILGNNTAILPAATDGTAWLLPLYAGAAWLTTVASQNFQVAITAVDPSVNALGMVVFTQSLINTQLPSQLVVLPRCACALSVLNTSSPSASLTFSWSLAPLEYAS
jgi:hypothetical protein